MSNHAVDPASLVPLRPSGLALNLHDGVAMVNLVGFRLLRTRLLGVPVPLHRDFDEVSLRFYVRRRMEAQGSEVAAHRLEPIEPPWREVACSRQPGTSRALQFASDVLAGMFDVPDRSGVELRHLETFAAVLEAGTFLAAARALGCSQSTVTLHMQELEQDLGLPLFERDGRRVRLTAAGESLRNVSQRVRDSVVALRRAADELRDGGAGEVALGAVEPAASLRVTPVLSAFSRLRPRLRLRLEVSGTATLSRQVAEGRLSFAVCSPPPASLGLAFEPCFRQRMALLLPRRHPLARQRRIRARDLVSARMLLSENGCAYREATEAALRGRGVQVECCLEIGSVNALHAAVRDGLGVALVPVDRILRTEAGLCLRELSDVDVTLVMGLARRDQPLATRAETALFGELAGALSRA